MTARFRIERPWALFCAAGAGALVACSTPGGSGAGLTPPPPAASSAAPSARDAGVSPPGPSASPGPADAGADGPAPDAGAAPLPVIRAEEAEEILFPAVVDRLAHRATCPTSSPEADRIRCLLGIRFQGDEKARATAVDLYTKIGSVAGVEGGHTMDGGYRGKIEIVSEPPVGRYRAHLDWVAEAARDHDAFFEGLTANHRGAPVRYRWRPIALRYFRSVGKRTPSAYAKDWTIAYNVSGSLNTSAPAVSETMFHETFHLNDADHGGWSHAYLGPLYDVIVKECGTAFACLKPYAPNSTTVKGGTYYAFQPGNGVGEYAAELAVRYYREQRAVIRKERPVRPAFKCGPPANQKAWELIVKEFFGGIDLTPPC